MELELVDSLVDALLILSNYGLRLLLSRIRIASRQSSKPFTAAGLWSARPVRHFTTTVQTSAAKGVSGVEQAVLPILAAEG